MLLAAAVVEESMRRRWDDDFKKSGGGGGGRVTGFRTGARLNPVGDTAGAKTGGVRVKQSTWIGVGTGNRFFAGAGGRTRCVDEEKLTFCASESRDFADV